MTERVAFQLPITDRGVEYLLELETTRADDSDLPRFAVESNILAALDSELQPAEYILASADSGRGASGYAVALEIIGRIADVGGTIAFAGASAKLVQKIFGRLTAALDSPPMISLGAACYLAAADCADRIGSADFRLHGAGDTRREQIDSSYTGNDCFFVIFEKEYELYFYAVDAYGTVTFLGMASMPARFPK
jgi:hypothetical protein